MAMEEGRKAGSEREASPERGICEASSKVDPDGGVWDYPLGQSRRNDLPSFALPSWAYSRRIGRAWIIREKEDAEGRRKIECMVGVCWPLLLVTYALIITVTCFVFSKTLPKLSFVYTVAGCGLFFLVLTTLASTACRDPGIFPRHSTPKEEHWRWSEPAQSFRPPGVVFCTANKVLVRDIDHFCPWTGTTIGQNNYCAFKLFLVSLFALLGYLGFVAIMGVSVSISP